MDILGLIPQFGGVIWTLIAFVVALSVIVAIHEYGHYIVGRWTGIEADVFSLGFGPVLFSRVDKHGTKWQFALLPFGGYVKFKGDANAASGKDVEAMEATPPEELRKTMHGAPLWARTLTVAAGPAFNFALSILVFTGFALTNGVTAVPLAVGELRDMPPEQVQDLQPGDQIIEIGGLPVPDFTDAEAFDAFETKLPRASVLDYKVQRDGEDIIVQGPYLMPPLVVGVSPQSAAMDIEIKTGDVITAIDGAPIYAFEQLKDAVEGSDGRVLLLNVWRDGQNIDFALKPKRTDEPQADGGFATNWRIGIAGGMIFEPATTTPGFGTAIWSGITQTEMILSGSISGLWHMITGAISTCNMSGPIGIAQVSGEMASQGAQNFIWFIAVLSAAVGLLNLFPIPALDGGHLVFYAYEAVVGKPPSDGALRILMAVGISLVLTLMAFALWNDIFCP
ncbi:Regulator of sigma-E protease RseP (plasmid) [Pseudoseohaeicola sp. NH-UV-7]|uniref:RIP metalloprotease RseP n=1 Tax=unclassified Sulfitobacter TaxID=196795 RepID=UPI000E0AA2AA|nr:RIP metalloprotease RseP [Sulfitobacter sp. JL08]AXI54692.1 RIP metalloprotease RseP [Sulfitobacter sp. JL08]